MKKKRKSLIIILIVILALIAGLIIFLNIKNNTNKLTLNENRWIDDNKYNVIDVEVLNNIPAISYNGDGIFYDFLDYVESNKSLKFNVIPVKMDSSNEYSYSMKVVDSIKSNDIVFLEDNLILLTKDEIVYNNVEEIKNLSIGIYKEDLNLVKSIIKSDSVKFIEYESYDELKTDYENLSDLSEEDTAPFDAIITIKSLILEDIVDKNISYKLEDLKKYFVLELNGSSELNSILTKLYNIWQEDEYKEKYNSNMFNFYFDLKDTSDIDQKTLKSKSYVYGFIDYGIYNNLSSNKISGLSSILLKDFIDFSGLSIKFTNYNSISKMLSDFSQGKVDFILNIPSDNSLNTYETVGVFNNDLIIISGIGNKLNISGINSLKDKQVLTIKDSYLEKYLLDNGVRTKTYLNLKDLVKDFDTDDIVIIDIENYNFYKTSYFADTKVNCILDISNKYSFLINNTSNNSTFAELFNFYLNYTSINKVINNNYIDVAYENSNVIYILVVLIFILLFYVVVDFSNHVKAMVKLVNKSKKIKLSKEDKIKYIDQLTSLKNRAYYNSRVETWDDSEVYPQAIIIIDLNNISYINDNFGREEGDKVITQAANIFIQNQLENTEIIRTDGNEFLIYMVGYNEKQVVSYIRKLNKEFKNLSHGFGAATGYSIISDAIKTIDDAVNEATLDMKNNKEDIDY